MKYNFRVQRLLARPVLTKISGVLVTIIFTASAQAGVLYSTLGPIGNAFNTHVWYNVGYANGTLTEIAAPFTSNVAATLTSIDVAAVVDSGAETIMAVSLYSDAQGAPGTPIESYQFSINPGLPTDLVPPTAVYTVTSSLHPTLSAGTQYWIVASDPTTDTGSLLGWSQTTTATTGSDFIFPGVLTSWQSSPPGEAAPAFAVNGTTVPAPVPVPLPLSLLGSGLAGLAIMGYRSKKREVRGE